MKEIEATGRTVDEAILKALASLGIKSDNAEVDVLNEPAQGIFSFIGNKGARVSVKVRYEPAEYLERYLNKMLHLMNLEGKVEITEDNEKVYGTINGNKVGVLIGRRGRTLNELQYLLNSVIRRQFEGFKKMVIIDVESYRVRRERTLTQLAKSIARKVIQSGHEQVLEPMTPQERRIIHMALQECEDIVTYSKGEEPYRKVIVAPR
ncbi:MAG: RNA-binding cell elongation regulator Jag/EloR [Bacillota bacterium]